VNTLISIAVTPGTVVEPMFAGQAQLQVWRHGCCMQNRVT
jgi:hypothetical protein